jgi:hypothetical protein
MNARITALHIYGREFRDCARSPEWKAGARRGLEKALGECSPSQGSPYASGTAQDDAWRAGVQAGLAEGKLVAHHGAEVADTTVRLSMSGKAAVRWLDDYATGKLPDDGRDAQGFRLDRGLIGEFPDLAEHHPAPPPCPANAAAQHAAHESQPPCAPAQPPAMPETDGGLQ